MPLRYSLSPSGGLLYHLIAWRRARTQWAPFRAQVRAWLNAWRPDSSRELIVFGPSAGWTLPLELLATSRRLTFVEPDPIARALLRRRLNAKGTVEFVSDAQILPWFSKSENSFEEFLAERPNADILFSNMLGQIALHFSKAQAQTIVTSQKAFLAALKTHRWASYHDLISGPRPIEQLKLTTLPAGGSLDPSSVFAEGVITDHETTWLSQNLETQLAAWPITESQTHIIGFVRTP